MKTFALLSLTLCLIGSSAWAADESATPPPAPGAALCQQDPQKCTEMRNTRHAWCAEHPGQCGRRSGAGAKPRKRNAPGGMGPGAGQGMQGQGGMGPGAGQGMQGQGGMGPGTGQGMRRRAPGNCGGSGQMPCQPAPAQPAAPAEAPTNKPGPTETK